MLKNLLSIIIVSLLMGCENIAVLFTPGKQASPSHTQLASRAENQFWSTLHHGRYDDISETNRLLMAAYLQNPNDPALAAHIGFLHIWKITERHRKKNILPTIVDEIVLSDKYFSDAVQLAPHDARFLGFLGDSQLVQGKIFHDDRQQTHGYFTLKQAIRNWPEFNYFTAGYVMSTLASQSGFFKEALAWQWATVDLCAGEKISRSHPDFGPYMRLETQQGPKRACWNSWIAPYNFEGFFLNMGDMLVKSGDWKTGIQIYKNAKLDRDYPTWPFRTFLEDRIKNAKGNVGKFQKDYISPRETILFNSSYGCAACHQKEGGIK